MIQNFKALKFESLVFFVTLYFSSITSKLFYNSYVSPDFEKYIIYINYFTNKGSTPDLDQGVLYFYIVSLFLNANKSIMNPNNQELIYSLAVQNANLFLYIIGIFGLYKLLKLYKYKDNDILILFSVLNMLPILFAIRVTMKPEILAFSLISWIIYFLKLYKDKKKFLYLYSTIPMLSILFTSKGSILGLTVVLLLLFFAKDIFEIFKSHFAKGVTILLVFIIFLIPIYIENNQITNSGVLSYEPPLEYRNTAPLSIIYSFDLNEFLNKPVRNSQAESFLGLTLLDTFGDYFQLYWEYEYSLTNTSRKEILKSGEFKIDFYYKEVYLPVSERFLNLEYYRIYISVLFTVLFYIFLIKSIISKNYDNERKVFFLLPFTGMALLIFQVTTGIPSQNWDPSKGDTLKPFYYSFLFVLSFSFLFIENVKKIERNRKLMLLIPLFFIYIFLIGFPKANNSSFDNQLIYRNQHMASCEINNLFLKVNLFETENIECKENYELFCDKSLFTNGDLQMSNEKGVIEVASIETCRKLFENNYQFENEAISLTNTPFVNLIYFALTILILIFNETKIWQQRARMKSSK